MFEVIDQTVGQEAVIKVIGVGGCGGNAVDHMVRKGVHGVEFIAGNTDAQALKRSLAGVTIQLGTNLTRGLGAGANPEIGRQAALEDRDTIAGCLKGANMIFITAGMGGGTGTGAAPIVAEVAKEMGILTVAVVTRPFEMELGRRKLIAQQGIDELSKRVDSLIIVPNEKLMQVLGEDATLLEGYAAANDVLHGAVSGIAEVINNSGMVNVDFADVRTVMSEVGMAMMGSGLARGPDRARIAAEQAVASPLLEDVNLYGARGILVNITSNASLKMREFHEVGNTVRSFAAEDAMVIVGTVIDEGMGDDLRVTIVATGLGNPSSPRIGSSTTRAANTRSENTPEDIDYHSLETPAVIRNARRGGAAVSPGTAAPATPVNHNVGGSSYHHPNYSTPSSSMETLEIPAFLRKQAD